MGQIISFKRKGVTGQQVSSLSEHVKLVIANDSAQTLIAVPAYVLDRLLDSEMPELKAANTDG